MEKALARNPNMLRALIGLSATLILILSYAVFSASLDSEYYVYTTSNEEEIIELNASESDSTMLIFTTSTTAAISWVNISVDGASEGVVLSVTSGGQKWWSHPDLGNPDAQQFNCLEPAKDFTLVNQCEAAFLHTMTIDNSGTTILYGLVDEDLPISGLGSLIADDLESATQKANQLVDSANSTIIWRIEVEGDISNETSVTMTIVKHELTNVEQFKLNPMTELVWSTTALLGCFALVLVVPMGFYYGSVLKQRAEERLREGFSDSEE